MWINKRIFEVTKEQILDGISKTKSVKELCELLSLKYGTLYARCREYGISLRCYITKWNIEKEEFYKYYELGYSDEQIGKAIGIPGKIINEYRRKNKIPVRQKEVFQFPQDQYQIIIGGLLGDSSMSISKTKKGASVTWRHSMKQKDYCLWKYEQLKEFCCKPYHIVEHDPRNGNNYDGITIKTKQNAAFVPFFDQFYFLKENGEKKKYINAEILNSLNELGLAIWFQDDGYKEKTGGYCLSTNCFSDEDLKLIQNYFLFKYDIKTTVHRSHVLYIPRKYIEKFTKLVEPYIQPCCKYKLHEIGHCKTPLNEETPNGTISC